MGKVWPLDSVAYHESTTALSNIVTIDESPLREGLIWVGTDDGLVQVTEDGGKNWRKIEQFPNVPQYTYVTDVFPSPRDANTVFVSLNNWQRGDYKPYIVKSTDLGRTWTNITGNLPDRHDVWSVIQDHVNGNLLFAGTEFGVFASVDGGQRWVQLKGGMPPIQVRDMAVQKRENDLVLGTFGRGFYVLDDYSALREMAAPEALVERCRASVSAARRVHLTTSSAWRRRGPPASARCRATGPRRTRRTARCSPTASTPTIPAEEKLVLTISDETGRQVRRLDLDKSSGLRRIAWNLRGDPPPASPADRARPAWRRRGVRRPRRQPGPAGRRGRYRATIGRMAVTKSRRSASRYAFSVLPIELK